MKIAVDLDGVLYHWEKTARYMLRTMRGYKLKELDQPSQSWDWIKDHVNPEDWKWVWTGAVKLGLFRYGHVMQGGIEGVRALSQRGHSLLVVTHRPQQAVQDTIDWLSYVNLPFAGVHILTNQENKSTVEAEVLIDDKPQNLVDWTSAGRTAIQFMQPWNRSMPRTPNVYRAWGWDHVVELVDDIHAGEL